MRVRVIHSSRRLLRELTSERDILFEPPRGLPNERKIYLRRVHEAWSDGRGERISVIVCSLPLISRKNSFKSVQRSHRDL